MPQLATATYKNRKLEVFYRLGSLTISFGLGRKNRLAVPEDKLVDTLDTLVKLFTAARDAAPSLRRAPDLPTIGVDLDQESVHITTQDTTYDIKDTTEQKPKGKAKGK
jgi:hypothetical protein